MVRRVIALAAPLIVSAPAVVLCVVTAIIMLMAAGGSHPLWRVESVNVSEAAAQRDRATVVRLIARGEDPYARHQIRADLLFNDAISLSPLEAGIAARRAEIVDVILFSARTPPEPATWTYLKCLAELEGDKDVTATLDRYRPESATQTCDGVTRPWKK
jgi:hypothetical protein